jgi:transposase
MKSKVVQKRRSDIIRLYRQGKSNRDIELFLKNAYGESVSYRTIGNYLNEWKKDNPKLEHERKELVPEVVESDGEEPEPERIYKLLMNRIEAIVKKRHLSTRQIRSLVESFTKLEAFRRAVLNDEEDNEEGYQKMIDELNKLN